MSTYNTIMWLYDSVINHFRKITPNKNIKLTGIHKTTSYIFKCDCLFYKLNRILIKKILSNYVGLLVYSHNVSIL